MPKQEEITGLEFYLNEYGVPALKAIIILIVGLIIIKQVVKLAGKSIDKKGFDQSLGKFLTNLLSWGLKALLVVTVMGVVGIPMTSFVAILGAAGLAIGLALQGTLANFAGGVLQMIFRPYKIGDFVEIQGESGTVKEIQIFHTVLTTPQNRRIIIPNGPVMNGNIKNYSVEDIARVDLQIGISYDADIKQAREIILNILNNYEEVLNEPATTVNVAELADSAIVLNVRPYTKTPDHWTVYWRALEDIKYKLDEANIGIPYPQMDVHVTNN